MMLVLSQCVYCEAGTEFYSLLSYVVTDHSGLAVKGVVCGGSVPGIAGTNPAMGLDVSLLRLLCVVR
jgi:hypothetical protein